MQLVVEAAGVANWFAGIIATPQSRGCGGAVSARDATATVTRLQHEQT